MARYRWVMAYNMAEAVAQVDAAGQRLSSNVAAWAEVDLTSIPRHRTKETAYSCSGPEPREPTLQERL